MKEINQENKSTLLIFLGLSLPWLFISSSKILKDFSQKTLWDVHEYFNEDDASLWYFLIITILPLIPLILSFLLINRFGIFQFFLVLCVMVFWTLFLSNQGLMGQINNQAIVYIYIPFYTSFYGLITVLTFCLIAIIQKFFTPNKSKENFKKRKWQNDHKY
jgi:hypothetical protein